MSEIFVIVEHRLGETRDITFEMLWKAGELAQKTIICRYRHYSWP